MATDRNRLETIVNRHLEADPTTPSTDSRTTPLAQVSRRWSAWAGNLLATGLILIAGLVFGRQVIHWWSIDASRSDEIISHAVGPDKWAQMSLVDALHFGDQNTSFRFRTLTGDRLAAIGQLQMDCCQAARTTHLFNRSPGPAEIHLLDRIKDQSPAQSEPGVWEVYQQDGPFPLAIAVRYPPPTSLSRGSTKVAAAQGRVVSWSIGLPAVDANGSEGRSWTLFTVTTGQDRRRSDRSSLALPLPPGSTRSMQMIAPSGASITGFSGPGSPDSCMQFFEQWAARQGQVMHNSAGIPHAVWHGRCAGTGGETLHFTVAQQDERTIKGLVVTMPRALNHQEK